MSECKATELASLEIGRLLVIDQEIWRIVKRTDSRFYIERADRPAGQETPRWIYRHRLGKTPIEIIPEPAQ